MNKTILHISMTVVLAMALKAQQTDFPKLTGPYLGQKPSGMTPETGYYKPSLTPASETGFCKAWLFISVIIIQVGILYNQIKL